MGCDKALLSLRGQPLIRHVYDAAAACSDRVVVVTPWPERYRPSLPDRCRYVEEPSHSSTQGVLQSVPQDVPRGPVAGFLHGLSAVDTDWVLLLACDLPHLRASVLQAWAQQLGPLPAQTVALLPRRADRWEPLCGFYRRSCQASLTNFLRSGERSFQRWLQHQQICPINMSDDQALLLYNCNTLQDWAQIAGGLASGGDAP